MSTVLSRIAPPSFKGENTTLTSHFRSLSRVIPLCGIVALSALAGCQSSQTIVARVGKSVITNEEFEERATRVKAQDLQQAQGLDAGAVAIISLVRERVISQLALEKHVEPRDEDIQRMVAYTKVSNPRLVEAIHNHTESEEDIVRAIRSEYEIMALGTDGARADEKEVDRAYEDLKLTKPQAIQKPASVSVRFLATDNAAQAAHALQEVQRTRDFATVAVTILHQPAQSVIERTFPLVSGPGGLPEAMVAGLSRLSPNQFTTEPIAVFQPGNSGQPNTGRMIYLFGECTGKEAAHEITKEEIRPVLEQRAILTTHVDWQTHEQAQLAAFAKELVAKGELEIAIKRYASLLDSQILPMLTAVQSPGGGAPGGPAPQGSAPPQGGRGADGGPGASGSPSH